MRDTISRYDPTILYHHGIKGQKWGVRRFQNKDGSLTAAGRQHVGARSAKGNAHRAMASVYALNERTYNRLGNKQMASMNKAAKDRSLKKAQQADEAKAQKKAEKQEGKKGLSDKQKKALKVGAAVAGTALAAYGTYKVVKFAKQRVGEKKEYEFLKSKADKIIGELDFVDGSGLYKHDDGHFSMKPNQNIIGNTAAEYMRSGSLGKEAYKDTAYYQRQVIKQRKQGAREFRKAQKQSYQYAKEARARLERAERNRQKELRRQAAKAAKAAARK